MRSPRGTVDVLECSPPKVIFFYLHSPILLFRSRVASRVQRALEAHARSSSLNLKQLSRSHLAERFSHAMDSLVHQYTPQQRAGGIKYKPHTLLGNWREVSLFPPSSHRSRTRFPTAALTLRVRVAPQDIALQEMRLADYLDKKEAGKLEMTSQRLSTQRLPLALSPAEPTLRFGATIMLRSIVASGCLAISVDRRIPGAPEHCTVTCSSSGPSVRTVMQILSYGGKQLSGVARNPTTRQHRLVSSDHPSATLLPHANRNTRARRLLSHRLQPPSATPVAPVAPAIVPPGAALCPPPSPAPSSAT